MSATHALKQLSTVQAEHRLTGQNRDPHTSPREIKIGRTGILATHESKAYGNAAGATVPGALKTLSGATTCDTMVDISNWTQTNFECPGECNGPVIALQQCEVTKRPLQQRRKSR
jgi:hypothetical protein